MFCSLIIIVLFFLFIYMIPLTLIFSNESIHGVSIFKIFMSRYQIFHPHYLHNYSTVYVTILQGYLYICSVFHILSNNYWYNFEVFLYQIYMSLDLSHNFLCSLEIMGFHWQILSLYNFLISCSNNTIFSQSFHIAAVSLARFTFPNNISFS